MLDSISTFFKEERDPFFIRGEAKGIEKGEAKKSVEVVANLIGKLGLTDEQVADMANVPVQFVKDVRKSLAK